MRKQGYRVGRLSFYAGKQERGYNGANPMWHGYAYGSWWPVIRRGSYCAASYIDAYWLCFHATIYWNKPVTKSKGATHDHTPDR